MSLFPLINEPDIGELTAEGLPLYRETDWDFKANQPIWRGGEPLFTTGARAVLVWAWNTLHTERFAHDVFSADYGPEFTSLLGKAYTEAVRESEAIRIVRETLTINPYITSVDQVSVSFEGSTMTLAFRMTTIYGEVTVDGCNIAL